jgi:general secretion pathway protein C
MCRTMVSRFFALLVWAACAAGLTYWGLRWFAKPLPVPDYSATVSMVSAPRSDMTRLLAAPASSSAPEAPAADQSALAARIQLIGLMAATGGRGPGVALLTVDSKPAKAFRVGQSVDGEYVVLAITRQGVDIGLPNSNAAVSLPAQALPPAATGTLTSGLPEQTDPNTGTATPPIPNPPVGNGMSGAFGGPPGMQGGVPPRPRQL